ncbi:inner-membrane translocator [Paenibacillus curdlanolyticus YK9]|uniref:Inner-membrane translocator n=1 Tax=Paenibacillus curdlanolyticus YK9 TaxID=717606 RepID=E0I5Y0_9BACL|nr:ABC transporter permease [Paenibacillus curdlanolyticus]EFM12372.1 inner-membrane translocator [Paenibacillus curdlanolyticus YK9]
MATIAYGTLELSLIYTLLALGMFISFRILDVPDLTVDGSFVTGSAVSAILTFNGHPFLSLLLAFMAGCIAGSITTFLHVKLKIHLLLAGILVMSALYSINIRIMSGSPNISLLNVRTIFNCFTDGLVDDRVSIMILAAIIIVHVILLNVFLTTRFGLALRATGNNEHMARSVGVNTDITKWTGLALSNGLVALSGAVLAQFQSFTDIGMGQGVIVIGLASVIIGEVIFTNSSMLKSLVAVVLGSIVYRFVIAIALQMGMPPTDLKLVSSTIVVLVLSIKIMNSNWFKLKSEWNKRSLGGRMDA